MQQGSRVVRVQGVGSLVLDGCDQPGLASHMASTRKKSPVGCNLGSTQDFCLAHVVSVKGMDTKDKKTFLVAFLN